MKLFRKPTMTGASVAVFAMAAAVFALLLFLVLYLQNALGYDALEAGLRLLPFTGGGVPRLRRSGPGWASARPPRALLAGGLTVVGVGAAARAA